VSGPQKWHFTVDANVVVKWYVNEPGVATSKARLLLQRWLNNEIGLVSPTYIHHEFANVMTRLGRDGHIPQQDVIPAIQKLLDYRIPMLSAEQLCQPAAQLTMTTGMDYYDALYAATAQALSFPLITNDRRLQDAMKASGLPVIKLREYN
jgi:predicted nucleic acid-binding protein